MTSKSKEPESGEHTCVVCFKTVDVYSVGICDHPVCYECSTRMRVLCKQMECPICRQEMNKVIFVKEVKPFSQLSGKSYLMDKQAKVCFENQEIQELFRKLLVHACNICSQHPGFPTIQQLKEHLRKEHEKYFCELCLDNLKIFTWERRCYTRSELGLHRRKGDQDDTSHRGHPLCQFCDQRYVDNDDLFRHLRRDHYFCHFCDADGLNQYYCNYEDLRVHFSKDHFLCEEGDCREEKFTRVFRTDIDLRAHRAQAHSHSLGKAAAKQARTLELEFTLAPRPSGADGRARGGGGQRRGGPKPPREEPAPAPPQQNGGDATTRFVGTSAANIRDPQQFPSLGSGDAQPSASGVERSSDSLAQKLAKNNRFTVRSGTKAADEEFPSLVVETSESSQRPADGTAKRSVYLRLSSQEDQNGAPARGPSGSNVSIQLTQNYPPPSQSGAGPPPQTVQPPSAPPPQARVTLTRLSSSQNIRVQPSANLQFKNSDDFPTLASASSQQQAVQQQQQQVPNWAKKEPQAKTSKAAAKPPPTKTKTSTLGDEDFPSLAPSKSMPSASWAPAKAPKSSTTSPAPPVNGVVSKAPPATVPVATGSGAEATTTSKKKKSKAASRATQDVNGSTETAAERKVSAMQIGALKSLSSHMGGTMLDLVGAANALTETAPIGSKISVVRPESLAPKAVESGGVKPKTKQVPSLSRDEFPALGSGPASNSVAAPMLFDRIASGPASRPSPSRQNSATAPSTRPSQPATQPPPGFSAGDLTPTKVTFTSSSGKSFPLPVEPAAQGQHVFLQPADFGQRNKSLITTITDLLGEQQDRFSQFRSLSSRFRSGHVTPSSYYHQCLEIMGEDCFLAVFPELLVLLPDIEKQQQLLKVHRSEMRLSGVQSATEPYVVCATCSQVLSPSDLKHHLSSHTLETHFPALSITTSGSSVDSNPAWSKR